MTLHSEFVNLFICSSIAVIIFHYLHKRKEMTIEIFNGHLRTSVESNNVPRVGDTLMGHEVTDVIWNEGLTKASVYIGKRPFWVKMVMPDGEYSVGLDSMPVVGDYVDIPDRYLVEKCVISEKETVCFAKRVL